MPTYRVVTREKDGQITHADYADVKSLIAQYEQTGIEEDSYTIRLHGEPVLKGLIGPMSEGKTIVRYETPEVFAIMTEEWSRQRRNSKQAPAAE